MKNHDVFIREGLPEDISVLRTIQKSDGFEHAYLLTSERLNRLFARGEKFYVALIDDTPVGFASLDLEVRARAHFLSVLKSYKGKGVGSVLMKTIIEEARDAGYQVMHTYAESKSDKEKFLLKFNFRPIGFYKDRYGSGKDATIWEVEL